jgi:hypothetical protein
MTTGTRRQDQQDKDHDKESTEMVRREFIKRFGAYTAGSALGLYVLMSPKTSRAAGVGSEGAPG